MQQANANRIVYLENSDGEFLRVPLEIEGDRQTSTIVIDGVACHLERIKKEELTANYSVDSDPDYDPSTDSSGYCYIMVPVAKR